jgi:hypothetical protein
MPLADQYQTFFAWTIHLDEAAAEHEQRGEDGSWLRNHLVESLGISQAEADLVRLAAHRNQTETKASNGRIFSAIMAHRAKSPNDPLPPEIEDMLQQRAAATMRVVSELEEKLGPETSAKIESWRENHLGANRQTIVQRPLPPAAVNAWKEFSTQQVDNIKERIRDRQQQIQRSGEPQGTPEVNQ